MKSDKTLFLMSLLRSPDSDLGASDLCKSKDKCKSLKNGALLCYQNDEEWSNCVYVMLVEKAEFSKRT